MFGLWLTFIVKEVKKLMTLGNSKLDVQIICPECKESKVIKFEHGLFLCSQCMKRRQSPAIGGIFVFGDIYQIVREVKS